LGLIYLGSPLHFDGVGLATALNNELFFAVIVITVFSVIS